MAKLFRVLIFMFAIFIAFSYMLKQGQFFYSKTCITLSYFGFFISTALFLLFNSRSNSEKRTPVKRFQNFTANKMYIKLIMYVLFLFVIIFSILKKVGVEYPSYFFNISLFLFFTSCGTYFIAKIMNEKNN